MRYTIYEHPLTHLFAFVPLPHGFVEGDELSSGTTDRWFHSREDAVAALAGLLDLEDVGLDPSWQDVTPNHATPAEDGRLTLLVHEDARRGPGGRDILS
jgi:hypothetical protein